MNMTEGPIRGAHEFHSPSDPWTGAMGAAARQRNLVNLTSVLQGIARQDIARLLAKFLIEKYGPNLAAQTLLAAMKEVEK